MATKHNTLNLTAMSLYNHRGVPNAGVTTRNGDRVPSFHLSFFMAGFKNAPET